MLVAMHKNVHIIWTSVGDVIRPLPTTTRMCVGIIANTTERTIHDIVYLTTCAPAAHAYCLFSCTACFVGRLRSVLFALHVLVLVVPTP